MADIFLDIGLIIILATAAAYLLKFFKQPMIPAYIIVGILIGPVFHLITEATNIRTLSEIGIAFLLFIVGLELDIKKLRDVGSVATVGALIQMGVLFVSAFVASVLLGFDSTTSIYLGAVMAFSSTMVVIKLLSDKFELDTLHGRIIIGTLLMQDFVAVIVLSLLKDIGSLALAPFLTTLAEGVGVVILAILLGKYVFPPVFKYAANHSELLFLASLSVCFAFSIIFAVMGFSIAIGAFIAGITLANLPYNIEIAARVKSLRDFFSVMFFTAIGAELVFVGIHNLIVPFIIFFLLTVVLVPIIAIIIITMFGYKTRTAFITGISLAQISEFGLIIIAQGLALGHISQEIFSLTIILAVTTMALTAYFIKYDDWLYAHFGKYFKPLEKFSKVKKELMHIHPDRGHDYILIGMDRIGYSILRKLRNLGKDVLVVDFNPDIIKKLISKHIPSIYGDIGDPEIIEAIKLQHTKMILSTIPSHQESLFLIRQIRKHHKDITIIVTSYQVEEALSLYEEGADYVIIPHFLGGEHMSLMLEDVSDDLEKLITKKLEHIRELRHRQFIHPHHR